MPSPTRSRSDSRTPRDGYACGSHGASTLVAETLTRLLADTYLVANTTQVLQWNVEALDTSDLGRLLGRQREELSDALDEIAERIRAQGTPVLGTLDLVSALSADKPPDVSRGGRELFGALIERHGTMVGSLDRAHARLRGTPDIETLELLQRRAGWHRDALEALRAASIPLWGAL